MFYRFPALPVGWIFLLIAGFHVAFASASPVATTTQLTVLSNGSEMGSVQAGSPVTLRATVIAANNTEVTPGQVIFCDASNDTVSKGVMADCQLPIATAQTEGYSTQTPNGPSYYGQASVTIYPAAGNRRYEAVFLANSHYELSSNEAVLAVAGRASTETALAVSGSSPRYNLTATVNTAGSIPATGSLTFTDTTTGAGLGAATLGKAAAHSSLTIASQPTSSDNGACSIVSGDFNGDGIADFAIGVGDCEAPDGTNSVAPLRILLGKGDGTFTVTSAAGLAGFNITALAAGDFNNDGFIDLVAAKDTTSGLGQPTAYAMLFLAGNGSGGFSATSLDAPCSTDPYTMLTADFNGDGNLDFAVNCPSNNDSGSGSTKVYLGSGNGTFTAGGSMPGGNYTPNSFGVADFNSDGFPDLAVGDADFDTVTVYLNDGTGSFSAGASFNVPNDGIAVQVGDFNGDGNADVVIDSEVEPASYTPGTPDQAVLTLEPGNGRGGFDQAISTDLTGVLTDTDGFSMVAADFNGDGITDLGMISGGNTAPDVGSVLALGSASGTFDVAASLLTEETGNPDYFAGAAGDFNKDGIPDLLISSSDLTTAYAVSVGHGLTQTAMLSPVSPVGAGTHSVIATYHGDDATTASTSAAVNLTATPTSTELTISATPNSVTYGSQVLLTATLSPYFSGSLTTDNEPNSVEFLNGSQVIGTGTLRTGVATQNLTSLPVGTNSITAKYLGDADFDAATSAASIVTVTAPATPASPAITPSMLNFSGTTVGSASTAQTITVQNPGAVALSISSIAASGNFTQTNTCGNSLAAGASCAISVAFMPASTGALTGTLTITDNASPQTQTVALSGIGVAASIAITAPNLPSGGIVVPTSGSTSVAITLTPPSVLPSGGIVVTCRVNFKGSGTPSNAPACTMKPSTVSYTSGGTAPTTTATITTGTQTAMLEGFDSAGKVAFAGLLLGVWLVPRRHWKGALLAILCMGTLGFAIGCGGGSHSSDTAGTTPGSYSVTITATAGSITGSTDIPFTVQ